MQYKDDIHSWLLYSCVEGGVVKPDESAWGRGHVQKWNFPGLDSGVTKTWASGCELSTSDDHSEIHDDPVVIAQVALFLATGWTPTCNVLAPSEPGFEPDQLGGISGELVAQAGGTSSQAVLFDLNNAVSGRLIVVGAGAGYSLWSPDGSQIVPSTKHTEQLADDAYIDHIVISPVPLGSVTIVLGAGPSASATLGFALDFDNGRQAVVVANPGRVVAGAPVTIVADVEDANGTILVGSNETITATVDLPDGTSQPVALFDDGVHGDGGIGDGVFGGMFTATTKGGRYQTACHAIVDIGADTVERSAMSIFAVTPPGAAFDGSPTESTPDGDGDGLFDSLTFSQNLSFSASGSFRVVATLIDSTGATIGTASANYDNDQGGTSATVSLVVPGETIVRHGVNGPWTLSNMTLFEQRAGLSAAVASDSVTQQYDYQSFARPATPSISWILPNDGRLHGGNQVVIGGTGFRDVTRVLVGEAVATFRATDDFSLIVTVPSLEPKTAKGAIETFTGRGRRVSVDVTISSPWGTTVWTDGYTYADG